MCVADPLANRFDEIAPFLFMGYASPHAMIARVAAQQENGGICAGEQVWTFLAACGYAAAGDRGVVPRRTSNG